MSEPPNVLLITFDSVRPDHLGCYGYRGTQTPIWDRLAAEGLRFSCAYCAAPNAWMSHAALFTGCRPPRNGVRSPLGKLNAGVTTLAELLGRAGYTTFGLPVPSLLGRGAGFDRGFDSYEVEGPVSEFAGAVHHRPLAATLEALRRWWHAHACVGMAHGRAEDRPAFVWLQYFGTHVAQGAAEEQMLELPARYRDAYSPFAQFYDGKIAHSDDGFLRPVLDMLGCAAASEQWVVVLTSDHGEDLAAVERGLTGHDRDLSEGSIRIPLVFWAPGRLPGGTVVEEPVRLIDVYPTLAELAGVAGEGISCDGESLLPMIEPDKAKGSIRPRDVYLENACQGYLGLRRGRNKLVLSQPGRQEGLLQSRVGWRMGRVAEALVSSRLVARWREQRQQRRQQRRLETPVPTLIEAILSPAAQAELYDLADDPGCTRNLAAERPDDVAGLRGVLRTLAEGTSEPEAEFSDAERAAIEQRLSDLGYL